MAEDHHVAWKDRLGLNKIWEQCILRCCVSYGTNDFIDDVKLLHNTLINIRDGPQLKTIIDDYIKGELREWKDDRYSEWVELNKADARIPELSNKTEKEINMIAHKILLNKMLQTLEDNGFGFYKSKLEEDEIL